MNNQEIISHVINNNMHINYRMDVIGYTDNDVKEAISHALELKDKQVLGTIIHSKVIAVNEYGEDDGTDNILLTKYLIDRDALIKDLSLGSKA